MHAKRLLILVGTFGLGFTTAWITKPVSPGEKPSLANTSASERVASSERPTKEAKNPRVAELLKAVEGARYNEAKTKEALDQVKTEEFSRLLGELVRRAGFTGLDYKDAESMVNLVAAWYDREPEAALGWVLAFENAKDREQLLTGIIGKVSGKDLKQGLALLQQYGRKENGGWLMPMELFQGLTQLGADGMASALGSFISTDGNSGGSSLTFPQDFDFRRLLDGVAEIQKGLKGEQAIGMVPSNLLSEWAKRDPSSAWEWLQQGKKASYASPDEFFKGYRANVSNDEFTSFLAEVVGDKTADEKGRFRTAWQALAEDPNIVALDSFMRKLPGDRSRNLLGLFNVAARGSGGRYDLFKEILIRQMSPDERASVLAAHFRESSPDKEFYTPLLQQLGHSDEEIQRMLSPAAER